MKAYIFDLDGVLIDSEKMMNHAWTICQLEHNLDQPFSEYFKHIGKPFKDNEVKIAAPVLKVK